MSEQKRNRIVAAITVNVILLIVILVAVVIYQIVYITYANNRKKQLLEEIKYYEQKIKEGGDTLEYYESYEYLMRKALELGYIFDVSNDN